MEKRTAAAARSRGLRYWLDLIEEPCPGCGRTGTEGTERCGNPCRDEAIERDFILCVKCSADIARLDTQSAAFQALDARITKALGVK